MTKKYLIFSSFYSSLLAHFAEMFDFLLALRVSTAATIYTHWPESNHALYSSSFGYLMWFGLGTLPLWMFVNLQFHMFPLLRNSPTESWNNCTTNIRLVHGCIISLHTTGISVYRWAHILVIRNTHQPHRVLFPILLVKMRGFALINLLCVCVCLLIFAQRFARLSASPVLVHDQTDLQ